MWILALAAAHAAPCDQLLAPEVAGRLHKVEVNESSGIAPSHLRPGVWFTHNDSGDRARLFAFTPEGGWKGLIAVRGTEAQDWEDIAAGPCPGGAGRCLYIADVGDNLRIRAWVEVHAVPEPVEGQRKVEVIASWRFTYASGPQDSESVMVHPQTGAIYVVTRGQDGRSSFFQLPKEPGEAVATLDPLGTVELEGSGTLQKLGTGADWRPDGGRVVLRGLKVIWEWDTSPGAEPPWTRPPDRSFPSAKEVQGEAIAYDPQGGLLSTSEGTPMLVNRHPCAAPRVDEPAVPAPPAAPPAGF